MRRSMARLALAAAAGVLFAGSLFAQDNYQFSDPNVEDLFRYARMAAGGGAVSKLKALQLKGRSKVDMGGSLLDCTVDIKILCPTTTCASTPPRPTPSSPATPARPC